MHYPSIEPKPVLKITISKDIKISNEDLKTEIEYLLASKDYQLPIKDVL